MSRSKSSSNSNRKDQKLFRRSKGFWGMHNNVKKIARQAVIHALDHSYHDRKARARDFRTLWISRINAACRLNEMSYSNFIHGLRKAGVELNRKVLAEMAVKDPQGFSSVVELAKKSL